MGEQRNPGDSTSFLVPQVVTPVGGWPIGSIGDYFGLPTVGQVYGGLSVTHSALPSRAYNLIFLFMWLVNSIFRPVVWLIVILAFLSTVVIF